MPRSRRSVAGAGTGSTPWAHLTVPPPTLTGEQTTRSGASVSISRHTPSTSATASMLPSSWKWMFSISCPWTAVSAAARLSKTASASARTFSDTGAAASSARISPMLVCS